MTTTEDIVVRPWQVDDEQEVLDLITLTMAGGPTGQRSHEFFCWKHRDNVFGPSPGMVATHDDRIVGVRLLLRWELEHEGRTLRCVRAVDTATHPSYLRRGIFKRLTLGLLDDLRQRDPIDLVFNTPNAASRPGYLRMGWSDVATLPIHVAPVRPLRFARGVLAARRANATSDASAIVDAGPPPPVPTCPLPAAAAAWNDPPALWALLSARRPDPRLRTRLDPAYLHWRYVAVPGLRYHAVMVHDGGELVGLGLGRMRWRASLREFTLSEIIVRDGDLGSASRILREARRCGSDHVTVHTPTGSEAASVLGRSGYLRVPGNGIRLVARPESVGDRVLDPDLWGVSLGELEVF